MATNNGNFSSWMTLSSSSANRSRNTCNLGVIQCENMLYKHSCESCTAAWIFERRKKIWVDNGSWPLFGRDQPEPVQIVLFRFYGEKKKHAIIVPIIIITRWLDIGTYKNIASEPLSVGWDAGVRVKGIKCEKCQNLFPTLNYCWVWDWEFVGRWQWQVPAVLLQKSLQSFNWSCYQCVAVVYCQLCVLVMIDKRKSHETVKGPRRGRRRHNRPDSTV